MTLRVELFAAIRRDRRDDPAVSGRTLAKRFRVSRRTVAAALANAVPLQRRVLQPKASVLDSVADVIDEMLRSDLTAPRKQRHTVRRILQRLITEHGFSAAYTTVRDYVRRHRPLPVRRRCRPALVPRRAGHHRRATARTPRRRWHRHRTRTARPPRTAIPPITRDRTPTTTPVRDAWPQIRPAPHPTTGHARGYGHQPHITVRDRWRPNQPPTKSYQNIDGMNWC